MTATPDTIRCYVDPGCPWTWVTMRWLMDAAPRRGITLEWRCVSLAVVNAGREVGEPARTRQHVAALLHRVMAAAAHDGRQDLVEAMFVEYGRRVHHDRVEPAPGLVPEVVEAAGAGAWVAAAADAAWDEVVATCTRDAMDLAGPDVGTPVLAWGDPLVGIYGPIVSSAPTGEAGQVLLDHVLALGSMPGFHELKRGRTGRPDLGERP